MVERREARVLGLDSRTVVAVRPISHNAARVIIMYSGEVHGDAVIPPSSINLTMDEAIALRNALNEWYPSEEVKE